MIKWIYSHPFDCVWIFSLYKFKYKILFVKWVSLRRCHRRLRHCHCRHRRRRRSRCRRHYKSSKKKVTRQKHTVKRCYLSESVYGKTNKQPTSQANEVAKRREKKTEFNKNFKLKKENMVVSSCVARVTTNTQKKMYSFSVLFVFFSYSVMWTSKTWNKTRRN